MYGTTFLAVASLAALTAAAPTRELARRQVAETASGAVYVPTVNDADGGAAVNAYTYYQGDGSAAAGWPDMSKWASYEALFAANTPLMSESCENNGWGANDTPEEIASINTAIESVAASTGVDHRFILAIMMQESKGCVRVITTDNAVVNPGLLQDHDGTGTCVGVSPCPQSEITQMITDGVAGTASGPGLASLINTAQKTVGSGGAQAFYAAARLYNSGSADYANLDDGLSSTACYASDVANRLMGWTTAETGCIA